jgi:glycogen debranching enzyme
MSLDALLSDEGWAYASSGAGRFHCLFGRDSLITALQVLPARADVARATLDALAARQGKRLDPLTGEEPGKIGHEFRAEPPASFVAAGWPLGGPFAYYGTADATCWFLVLSGVVREFGTAGRAAAAWLADALDAGGGLVRHVPGEFGLTQQGWRDTIDAAADTDGGGYVRADGTNPVPPLADIDTQAAAVAALRALVGLTGDPGWARRLDALRGRLSALPVETMAVEAGDVVVPGAGSQLGWLLWADAVEDPAPVAERLCADDILTAFGLRTLAATDANFHAHAYHRGSVWPFDSWLGWGGLRAAGYAAEAERVRAGVLAALDALGSAHELYAVTEDGVAPIATSNAVQAWTVGARIAFEHDWDGRAPLVG